MVNPDPSADLLGYVQSLSVRSGEPVSVAVHSSGEPFSAKLVELHGPTSEFGHGDWSTYVSVADAQTIQVSGATQELSVGSYAIADLAESELTTMSLSVNVWFWQSLSSPKGVTTVLGVEMRHGQVSVRIDERQHLIADMPGMSGAVSLKTAHPLAPGHWYGVTISTQEDDPDWNVVIASRKSHTEPRVQERMTSQRGGEPITLSSISLAAASEADVGTFDGKVDSPRLWFSPLSPAELNAVIHDDPHAPSPDLEWSFIPSDSGGRREPVPSIGRLDTPLHLKNRPDRAVTGRLWTGDVDDYRLSPLQYSAARFHSDAIAEADWATNAEIAVPTGCRAGAYAVELRTAGQRRMIPFFVRGAQSVHSRVTYLAPTLTYLAYANDRQHHHTDFKGMVEPRPLGQYESLIDRNPQLGSSLYDPHPDGSPWIYSALQRPLVNVSPDYVAWISGTPRHFSADLALLEWLRREVREFDVITDHVLHEEGLAALSDTDVLVTGSHPEYVTLAMHEAIGAYLDAGGKLMYMGGNGFYWVTAVSADGGVEVRRGYAGTRSYSSAPGELTLSTEPVPAGLWRHRGRSPNALVGVGFCAQGWRGGAAYTVASDLPSSLHRTVFGDLGPGAILRTGGSIDHPAADEVDRVDPMLGTPPQTKVLASSQTLNWSFQPVIEDQNMIVPGLDGSQNPDVRSDVAYLPLPSGGAVFSVGSIAWAMHLPVDNYRNDLAKVSTNVLRAMMADEL